MLECKKIMISREFIHLLSSDEKVMLLYIVNILNTPIYEIDLDIISCFNYSSLIEKIKNAKNKVKEEFLPIYNGLYEKFETKSNC